MILILLTFWKLFVSHLEHAIRRSLRPAAPALALGAITDLSRSRADLLAENALLRQQLIVLNRQVKRPALTIGDRVRLGLLARCTRFWREVLLIVQPDTLLRWRRGGDDIFAPCRICLEESSDGVFASYNHFQR